MNTNQINAKKEFFIRAMEKDTNAGGCACRTAFKSGLILYTAAWKGSSEEGL